QEVVVAAWGRESVARASEENLTQVPYRVCGSLKFGCSGAPGTLPGLLCRTVETQETPQDEKTGSESLGPRFLQDTFLQASQIAPEQIAGPRRFADASAMRLDLEPVLLHPAVADASSMHRRCGAILRPHLLRPHSGSQKVTISGRPCMRFWGARRYRIKRRRTCRRGLPGGGEPSEPTIGIVEPIVSQLPKPEKETLMQILRLLSAPVYSSWLPILIGGSVFAGIRARGLRQAAKGSQALLEYLCTRTVLLKSADAVASIGMVLPGGAKVEKGDRVMNPGALGPVLSLTGLGGGELAMELLLAHPRRGLDGPVYQSRCRGFVMCGLDLAGAGQSWAVFSKEQFERCAAKDVGNKENTWEI
ncbi:unnamed protein product, partial [Prorocentrum cordatum]